MKRILLFTVSLLMSLSLFAQQDTLEMQRSSSVTGSQKVKEPEEGVKEEKKLAISGYFQSQFQHGQRDAALKVGGANEDKTRGYSRLGIRRGRVKLLYTQGIATSVFQMDLTDKGLQLKDAYLKLEMPGFSSLSGTIGVFDRPFGYEISYSSSQRESPERSALFQALFPEERDLGAKVTFQLPEGSPWSMFKLDAGWFAGNGVKMETDSRKDFIGRFSMQSPIKQRVKIGAGFSYYKGNVYQGSENVYRSNKKGFELDSEEKNIGKYAVREYFGWDAQLSFLSKIGLTKLTSEYIFGTQPGSKESNKSPNASILPTNDVYIRSFRGGYVMFVQDIGKLPISVIAKYDVYNPNTHVKGDQIGKNNTGEGDISYTTMGMGFQWRVKNNIRFTIYHDQVINETSASLKGFESDRKDNVLTYRIQYKF